MTPKSGIKENLERDQTLAQEGTAKDDAGQKWILGCERLFLDFSILFSDYCFVCEEETSCPPAKFFLTGIQSLHSWIETR